MPSRWCIAVLHRSLHGAFGLSHRGELWGTFWALEVDPGDALKNLHCSHSTCHISHFTIYTPHYTPRFELHTLHYIDSTLCTLHFTLDTLHTTHTTLHTSPFPLCIYSTHCALHAPDGAPHTPHAFHTPRSTLYTLCFTLNTPPPRPTLRNAHARYIF